MSRVLVSACLLGQPVRYDGRAKTLEDSRLATWQAEGRVVPLCPELAAGLPVPRLPAEIEDGSGRVFDSAGADVTKSYQDAADRAVETAKAEGCAFALLTDKSPSCGVAQVYAGAFDGTLRAGRGLVAEALSQAGVRVFADHQIAALEAAMNAEER